MKNSMSVEQINLVANAVDKVFNAHQKTLVIVSMLNSCSDGDYSRAISKLEQLEKVFTKF